MRRARFLLAGALTLAGTAAAAQPVTRSAGPQSVAVTVYRAPDRNASQAIDLRWLNGYALVTERRRVSLPAGESDLRFEGVSAGILPQSAIVTGFPGGVVEKNQDALLLSPAGLVAAYLGKRVHLRRTSRATGAVRETEAIVRSGPEGAVVIETADGVEALRCSGLAETLAYDRVPLDLSAKPTLSVKLRSPRAVTATVELSYLASDFDWQANYVAELAPDGRTMSLFAWLTLASGDETSFVGADAQAVAGRLNRTAIRADKPEAPPLRLDCWPSGTTTSDLRELKVEEAEAIVVTGSRIARAAMAPAPPPPPPPPPPAMMAQQEELGDLKLYRIPQPVTVAAHSQKQVALLVRRGVKVETVYRQRVYATNPGSSPAVMRVVATRNEASQGLGLPLPAGGVTLFAGGRERPILLGRGAVEDKAVGEKVEIAVGRSTGVAVETVNLSPRDRQTAEWELKVTNSRAEPVRFEAELEGFGRPVTSATALDRRDGRPLWAVTLAAGEEARLRYSVPRS